MSRRSAKTTVPDKFTVFHLVVVDRSSNVIHIRTYLLTDDPIDDYNEYVDATLPLILNRVDEVPNHILANSRRSRHIPSGLIETILTDH